MLRLFQQGSKYCQVAVAQHNTLGPCFPSFYTHGDIAKPLLAKLKCGAQPLWMRRNGKGNLKDLHTRS